MRCEAKASICEHRSVLRDTGVSPRAGTSQRDLAPVHNGRAEGGVGATNVKWWSATSGGPVLGGEWHGTYDGGSSQLE